jgi:hypothetical protein
MARQSLHQQIPEGPQEQIESGSLKPGSELPYVTALTIDPRAPQVGNSTSVLDLITHAIRIAPKSNSLAFRTIFTVFENLPHQAALPFCASIPAMPTSHLIGMIPL